MYLSTDVHDKQSFSWPLVSAKTIAKVEQEQEMLQDLHVKVCELWQWIPKVSKSTIGNLVGAIYDKTIRKMPQRMQKCIDHNGDYIENVTFIANKRVFYMKKN